MVYLYPRSRLTGCLRVSSELDLYRVLEVEPSAKPAVIEAAYRRLALRYHPDLNSDDPAAESQMKRINQAYHVLRNSALRADYDARSGVGMPELAVFPSEVTVRGCDPNAREISFSVRLRHVSGPQFDPSKHRIDLALFAPWHEADVHWRWSDERLPADVEFTLAFGEGLLKPGTTLSGDIEVKVTARDQL